MRYLAPLVALATPVAVGVLLSSAAAEPLSAPQQEAVNSQHGPPIHSSDGDAWLGADARGSPYTAVGRITGTMVCTAAIVVHPRIIVTAGHCIARRDGSPSPIKPTFQLAKGAGITADRFEATVWAVGSRQRFTAQSAQDAANDWAILVLDRPPVGIRPLRVRNRSAEELIRLQRQILMPGYMIGAAGALSLTLDPACSVRGLMWNVLLHDCQASHGASGAPLLTRDRQWYAVVGIHTGSMFASKEDGHVAGSIGNSAIGAWSFAEAVTALSRSLQAGAADDVTYQGH